MNCEACGDKSCFTHDIPWHQGLTCSEYETIKRGVDKATEKYIKKETKPCPSCGVRIVKTGGCDSMVCTIRTCNSRFNWSWY